MCTRTRYTKHNRPSNWPWARSRFAQQLGSAQLAAQGTPAPVAPLWVLVLTDTHYRALWDVALEPLPSGWSPEPPITSCTNTHTNGGLSQTPESLQQLAWTPSSSSCIIQMHTGFILDFMATPKSLLLLPLLLHCPRSSRPTHTPSPDPATGAFVTYGQTQPAGTETPMGTHSIEPLTQ